MSGERVLLLSIDSLRYDRFTPAYFPACWPQIAREFVRFQRAISPGVATPFAMPGPITGTRPAADGTIDTDRSIAHAFDRATALSNNPHLGPDRGYDAGFDTFSTGPSSSNRTIDATIDAAIAGMQAHDLTWVHVMEPHFPWDVPDRLNDRFIDGTPTPAECKQLRAGYADAIWRTNRELARLFEHVDFEDTMVVLLADHGESFGEQGIYNHPWDAKPIDALVHVPLAVSIPGEPGGTREHLVSLNQVTGAIRERSLAPLESEPGIVHAYSNDWTRIESGGTVSYRQDSPFDMDELFDTDRGVLDRLKALGYR